MCWKFKIISVSLGQNNIMARVNKFNIRWQIIRTNAKKYKNVDQKIDYVLGFLRMYNSKENYARVKNWLTMTAMGYREQSIKILFSQSKELIETIEYDKEDEKNDFSIFSIEDLIYVHKDLTKRKYGFQYSKVPVSHINFMRELTEYLDDNVENWKKY
jgi:hypothetical protein